MALQMGMPRLDFYLNTSTGILTSTEVLDREQIGQYHLRIIAYDAGKFPRTSTSTLTITGEQIREVGLLFFHFGLAQMSLDPELPSRVITHWAGCYHLLVGCDKTQKEANRPLT